MEAPELMPISEPDARAAFGLTKRGLKGVPILETLPGVYTTQERPYRRKRYLLNRERARQAAIEFHGGKKELARYVKYGTSKAKLAYDRRVAARQPAPQNFWVKHNPTKNHQTRYMTVVPLPYYDPCSRLAQKGVSCQGYSYDYGCNPFRAHSVQGIFDHFKKCPGARKLWRAYRLINSPNENLANIDPYIRYLVKFVKYLSERDSGPFLV